jgi:aldehyde dehydrogenase
MMFPPRAAGAEPRLLRDCHAPMSPAAAALLAVVSASAERAPAAADLREPCMFENYIDGAWRPPLARRYLTTAPGTRGGSVARACARDVALACAAARGAAADWLRCGGAVRRAALGQLPARIAAQALALAVADAWDRALEPSALDLGRAEQTAADVRDLVRALRPPAHRERQPGVPGVARLVHPAETADGVVCRRLLPLLYEGRVAVVLLLYPDGPRLPVRLLQLLGIVGAALPAGVLNVLSGLGLEAGVALVQRAPAPARPGPLRGPTGPGVDGDAAVLTFPSKT